MSLIPALLIPTSLRRRRSIPYSSGLSFRCGNETDGLVAAVYESQSLIHQVSVSDVGQGMVLIKKQKSLNPLFIRSQFQI